MNEFRRAPDPTLAALDWDESVYIWPVDDRVPRVAHLPATATLDCLPDMAWHEEARDAQWFAVACRVCFPEAPKLGHRRVTKYPPDGVPYDTEQRDRYLTWQHGVDNE